MATNKAECHQRKKCVKSSNCFRDRQEFSSLYTISSHSTSYEGDNHHVDAVRRARNETACACCVHRGCTRAESQFDYVRQCCKKPCCHPHDSKYRSNLRNLEENYWARWKPNKSHRPRGCCRCDCPKSKEVAPRQQGRSQVEVLREPKVLKSNSSNLDETQQPSAKNLYDQVLSEYQNHYSEDNLRDVEQNPVAESAREEELAEERGVRFDMEEYDVPIEFETAQHEDAYEEEAERYYEDLYADMYDEYGSELLSRMPSSDQTQDDSSRVEFDSGAESVTITDSVTVLHEPNGKKETEASDEEVVPPQLPSSENLSPKHTDSSIINSQKQKENGRTSTAKLRQGSAMVVVVPEPPPLKGHTYPLKSTLKREKDKAKGGGKGRANSPGSRSYLPAYLQRVVGSK